MRKGPSVVTPTGARAAFTPGVDPRAPRKPKHGWPLVQFREFRTGEVVDVGRHWIAVLSIEARDTATVITSYGDKALVEADGIETEVFPSVWVTRIGATADKLRLKFTAPRSISIKRRKTCSSARNINKRKMIGSSTLPSPEALRLAEQFIAKRLAHRSNRSR